MKQLLSRIGEKVRLRRWELLAYPVAAAAAAGVGIIPGKTLAYDDPSCPNCSWIQEVRPAQQVKWCLTPGIRDNCSFLYVNYEYARWVTERLCENQMDLCYTCGALFASGCCIWLIPELPCCDENHLECPGEQGQC